MALLDTSEVPHGMNKHFTIDNSGGTPTDISDSITSIDVPENWDEAEVGGGGTSKQFKLGQYSAEITIEGPVSKESTSSYMVLAGVAGTEDLDFIYGEGGSGTGMPKRTGKSICKGLDTKTDSNGVPTFTAKLRPTGAVTRDTFA